MTLNWLLNVKCKDSLVSICIRSSYVQPSSSITKQSSEDKRHTHSDRDGDPTTYGTGCAHTHARTHTQTH